MSVKWTDKGIFALCPNGVQRLYIRMCPSRVVTCEEQRRQALPLYPHHEQWLLPLSSEKSETRKSGNRSNNRLPLFVCGGGCGKNNDERSEIIGADDRKGYLHQCDNGSWPRGICPKLSERYQVLQKRYTALTRQREDKQFKADELGGFLFELGELDLLDHEWKDSRFRATVERIIVHNDGRLVFTFTNGSEETVMM